MIRRVHRQELNRLAEQWHFSLDDSELGEFHVLTEWLADRIDELDRLPVVEASVLDAERDAGRPATPSDDPYNAIVRWCRVRADADGLLTGARLGVKDTVAIAGIPRTCGSMIFQSFVPSRDSVVTERILRAGGEIVCTTNMDDLATSGGGDTSAFGYTRNPFDSTRTAGGSSGGSGSALYYDDVDITIGCDQGGSIRVPSAWCGVVGLKPTHGLVPYTTIAGIDPTYDHCGPLARTVTDAARLLQVIAGQDPSDPRQAGGTPAIDCLKTVEQAPNDLRGVRIGIVTEGFSERIGVQPEVAEAASDAIDRLRELGADARDVALPEHVLGESITLGSSMEGMAALIAGGGNGYHWKGQYWPEMAAALEQRLAAHGNELSPPVKLILLFGTHMQRAYLGAYYAKAQNLRPLLRAGYDRALAEFDILVMPTTPGKPHEYVPDMSISENVKRGWGVLANTSATDMSGHPAITIPAAEVGGLPIGLMLIGRSFDDARLLQLARTYERQFGWAPHHPGDPRRPPQT